MRPGTPLVQLPTFPGCPHTDAAERAVATAIERAETDVELERVDLAALPSGSDLSRYPSPTVLVAGVDVSGESAGTEGLSCRASGAPTAEAILWRIAASC